MKSFALAAILSVVLAGCATGRVGLPGVRGRVVDLDSVPIPGATVVLVATPGEARHVVESDRGGRSVIQDVCGLRDFTRPCSVDVRVVHAGVTASGWLMLPGRRQRIVLAVDGETLDIRVLSASFSERYPGAF